MIVNLNSVSFQKYLLNAIIAILTSSLAVLLEGMSLRTFAIMAMVAIITNAIGFLTDARKQLDDKQ